MTLDVYDKPVIIKDASTAHATARISRHLFSSFGAETPEVTLPKFSYSIMRGTSSVGETFVTNTLFFIFLPVNCITLD